MAETATTAEAARAASEAADDPVVALTDEVNRVAGADAARLLGSEPDEVVVAVLRGVNPAHAQGILAHLPLERRRSVLAVAPPEVARQWSENERYPKNSVGRLMDPAVAVFPPDLTVGETIERLRELVKRRFITYGWVVDGDGALIGVLVMRDLLFTDVGTRLADMMLKDPFSLRPETDLMDAMRLVLARQYPEYPVCDATGRLVGVVRGQVMAEAQAFEISAQAGARVGVEKEERLATPWPRSLRFRHPWLQLNLLTAFVAGAVESVFQETIDQLVILAVFLPVLAGQSGNTGCQALAVSLRGMTLGDLKPGSERKLVMKEALLGALNGLLVGLSAGVAMFLLARSQDNPNALVLGLVVLFAMTGSCLISGVSGALVPMALKRLGADPATASSIFLTTATDVASMGMLLGLATMFVR
jgi:magnesium transporter